MSFLHQAKICLPVSALLSGLLLRLAR